MSRGLHRHCACMHAHSRTHARAGRRDTPRRHIANTSSRRDTRGPRGNPGFAAALALVPPRCTGAVFSAGGGQPPPAWPPPAEKTGADGSPGADSRVFGDPAGRRILLKNGLLVKRGPARSESATLAQSYRIRNDRGWHPPRVKHQESDREGTSFSIAFLVFRHAMARVRE